MEDETEQTTPIQDPVATITEVLSTSRAEPCPRVVEEDLAGITMHLALVPTITVPPPTVEDQ